MKYENFYETVKEANMRLRGSVILYDGLPYHVAYISDHMKDGVWRIYMDEFGSAPYCQYRADGIPIHHYNQEDAEAAKLLDTWLETNSNPRMIRKMMNSPKFDSFKPFPLGYYSLRDEFVYVERHPTRKSEQGLTNNALVVTSIMNRMNMRPSEIQFHSDQMRATILGDYNSFEEAYDILSDTLTTNKMVAFHRDLALVRGPLDMIFLSYKTDIVGLVDNKESIKLGKKFMYLKEVIENANCFEVKNACN